MAVDIKQVLRSNRLFAGFSDNGIAILATVAQAQHLAAGASIYAAGDEATGLYLLVAGRVRFARETDHGPVAIGEIEAGEPFGQLALLRSGLRGSSATAATEIDVVEIGRERFIKLQAAKPQACLKLLMAICTDYAEQARIAAPALTRLIQD